MISKTNSSKTFLSSTSKLKGGHFLIEETSPEDIFIAEEWSEEQRMIAEMVTDFCIKEVQEPFFKRGRELEISREEDRSEILEVLRKAGELGLCGISIPEEYGGMGLDFTSNTIFSERISAGFSFATTIGAQTSIGSLPIVYYGNETQKNKYLPKIATGEWVAAYALTEPEAGSDANSGKSKAVLSEDKKTYLLNGQKVWITNGGIADVFIVFAKIDQDKTLSAFIVERNFEGLTIGPEEKKMGIKGSSTVQLYFDNCKIPVENLLGEREGGFKMALNILNSGRMKAGSGGVGGCKFSLTKAVEYAINRKQFGKSITEFGAIQYKIGDIAMQTFAMDAAMYRNSHNIDLKTQEFETAGMPSSEAKIQAVREFAIECSIIKVKGSVLACYTTDEVLQIHGGMGYAVETGIEMAYRDARITKIYEGTNEVNRLLTIAELSKRSLQTKEIDLMVAGKKIPKYLLKQLIPMKSKSDFAVEERTVKGIKNAFLLVLGAAGKKLRKKMVDEQEIILNLSDMLAEAYICESVLLKVKKLQQKTSTDKTKLLIQEQMMQLYLYEALAHVQKAAKEAVASFTTGLEKGNLNRMLRLLLPDYDMNPKELRRNIAAFVVEKGGYCF
ncbi:MAG: acyl-CoA dehydrogenase family protein [Chitinophagales bacterium]